MQVYIALQCVSSNAFIFMVDDIEVYAARDLTAGFTASNTSPAQGATVNFTDQSTGSPTAWAWSFPGGTPSTSTQQNPTGIKYLLPGSFDVTLVVTKGTEKDSLTKPIISGNTKLPFRSLSLILRISQALPLILPRGMQLTSVEDLLTGSVVRPSPIQDSPWHIYVLNLHATSPATHQHAPLCGKETWMQFFIYTPS